MFDKNQMSEIFKLTKCGTITEVSECLMRFKYKNIDELCSEALTLGVNCDVSVDQAKVEITITPKK